MADTFWNGATPVVAPGDRASATIAARVAGMSDQFKQIAVTDLAFAADLAAPTGAGGVGVRRALRSGGLGSIRTVADKGKDRFDLRDMAGVDLTGSHDMAATVEAAAAEATAAGAILEIPGGAGQIVLGRTVPLPSGCVIQGQHVTPYDGSNITPNARGNGSWFHVAHSGRGFVGSSPGNFGSGVQLRRFGMYWDQPAPTAGWTPNDNDFAIVCSKMDMLVEDVVLLNPTRGILTDNGPAGRLELRRVRGQPFEIGLQCDSSYDGLIVDRYRWWPFWSNDAFTKAFTMANRIGLYLRHCDNPSFHGLFDIYSRFPVLMGSHPDGIVSRATFVAPEFDQVGENAFTVQAGADGTSFQIAGGYTLGAADSVAAGQNAIDIEANNCVADISTFRVTQQKQRVLVMNGTGNQVNIAGLRVEAWNTSNTGLAAIDGVAGNKVTLSSYSYTGGNGAKFIGNVTLVNDQRQSLVETNSNNGVTDATAAIQTLLTGLTYGGEIALPRGVYLIGSGITLPDFVTISGAGKQNTTLVFTDANAVFTAGTGTHFKNLKISVASGVTRTAATPFVRAIKNAPTFENCSFEKYSLVAEIGSMASAITVGARFLKCDFSSPQVGTGNGAVSALNYSNFIMDGCIMAGLSGVQTDFGLRMRNGDTAIITNTNFTLMGRALLIDTPAGQNMFATKFSGCLFDSAGTITSGSAVDCAMIAPAGNVDTISFDNSWFGLSSGGAGCSLEPSGSGLIRAPQFSNCQMLKNSTDGIRINGAGVQDASVTTSSIGGNGYGVRVLGAPTKINIANNRIGNTAGRGNNGIGIELAAGCAPTGLITANIMGPNTFTDIDDQSSTSTTTLKIINNY